MSVTMHSKQKGITLMESLLALAVGAALVGGGLLFFKSTRNSANIAATIKRVDNISDAMRTYAQTSSYAPCTTSCLSTLQTQGLLTSSDMVNPWSSSTPPMVFTSGNYMGIYFNSVPSGICAVLAKQLSNSLPLPAATPAGSPVTLNGVAYTITSTGMSGTWAGCSGTCSTGTINGAAGCQTSTGTPLAIIMDLS